MHLHILRWLLLYLAAGFSGYLPVIPCFHLEAKRLTVDPGHYSHDKVIEVPGNCLFNVSVGINSATLKKL